MFRINLKMEAKSLMVKQLFDRGFPAGKIFKQLKCLSLNKTFISIYGLFDINSYKDRLRSGRPRSLRTKERNKRIDKKI